MLRSTLAVLISSSSVAASVNTILPALAPNPMKDVVAVIKSPVTVISPLVASPKSSAAPLAPVISPPLTVRSPLTVMLPTLPASAIVRRLLVPSLKYILPPPPTSKFHVVALEVISPPLTAMSFANVLSPVSLNVTKAVPES